MASNGKVPRQMPMGNPADYPIGSPESRAAARAMLEAMRPPPLTPEEIDWLIIASCSPWITMATRPGPSRPEYDAKIKRAHQQMDEIRSSYTETTLPKITRLCVMKQMLSLKAAWERRMPDRIFPFRILADGKILERVDYNKWCVDRWLEDEQDSRIMWCPWRWSHEPPEPVQ